MMLEREKAKKFQKKFSRRTTLLTWLCCAAFLNAVDHETGQDKIVRPLLTQQGDDSYLPRLPHRPFAPHVKVTGASEIQVSWLPVLVSSKQLVRYELFSGDDPEYIGYDLVYVAKRLKPGTEYRFRVRACSLFGCSDFSLTRSCKTADKGHQENGKVWKKPVFGKRRIFLHILPPLAVITFFITLVIFFVYFWRFLRYYLWLYSSVSFDPMLYKRNSLNKNPLASFSDLEMGEKASSTKDEDYLELTSEDSDEEVERFIDCVEGNFDAEQSNGKFQVNTNKMQKPKNSRSRPGSPKSIRGRASSLEVNHPKKSRDTRIRSVSEGEIISKEASSKTDIVGEQVARAPSLKEESLIVIDNSNVFIGAREAACALNSKLRPRHVKVRLQALAQVLESGRKISRRFACGSSPPANEHVWDVYRRLGYTIDLEDRRGKDEQRVDEQLHLCIYKAIIEMPPHTLVLASGDGNKGKSNSATSFPECVVAAIEHGWNVEVHSWKHSLSAEWLKLAAKHKNNIKIKYLDENIHKITSVDTRGKGRDRGEDNSGREKSSDNRVRA